MFMLLCDLLHTTVVLHCTGMLWHQAWLIDAIEVLVIAFAVDDIARTFHLGSFSKGLVGSASFLGEGSGVSGDQNDSCVCQ